MGNACCEQRRDVNNIARQTYWMRSGVVETERERENERQRQRETDRQIQTDTDRDTERDKERKRDYGRETGFIQRV